MGTEVAIYKNNECVAYFCTSSDMFDAFGVLHLDEEKKEITRSDLQLVKAEIYDNITLLNDAISNDEYRLKYCTEEDKYGLIENIIEMKERVKDYGVYLNYLMFFDNMLIESEDKLYGVVG